jgi:phosphate transport system protein
VPTVETMEETRKSYHSELDELRALVVRLGASVIEVVPRATNVLLSGDLEGADYLVQSDDEIDARAHDIESRTFEILALQAPVAGELRQLVSILKITSDLERSADLAVNICKAARRIYGKEIDPVLRGLISKMSEQAEQLYQAAINSFAENDAATAAAIEDMDSFLDALHRQFVQAIFETHARERMDLQLAVQLAIVARFYERIGDHAVNVGERVQFALTGWKPELRAIQRQRQRDATGEFPVTQG